MLSSALSKLKSVVVLAPHPDDEAIGCFAAISQLRRRGVRVEVIVVTDGAASHRNSIRFPKARLARMRQRETVRVMKRASISRSHITFLNLPDGALADLTGKQISFLRRNFQKHSAADAVIGPSAADAHPDHRAVYHYWNSLFSARPLYFAYMVWPASHHAKRRRSPDAIATIAGLQKRAAICQYRSQTGAITDDPDGFSISRTDLQRFSKSPEIFRSER